MSGLNVQIVQFPPALTNRGGICHRLKKNRQTIIASKHDMIGSYWKMKTCSPCHMTIQHMRSNNKSQTQYQPNVRMSGLTPIHPILTGRKHKL